MFGRWLRKGRAGSGVAKAKSSPLQFETMEPRLLLSADPLSFLGGSWDSGPEPDAAERSNASSFAIHRAVSERGQSRLDWLHSPAGLGDRLDWLDNIWDAARARHGIKYGDVTYFSKNDLAHGRELWKLDAANQPELVADINSGRDSSSPRELIEHEDHLFFTADDGSHGRELWSIASPGAAPAMVLDINSGEGSSAPKELTAIGSTLYFSAFDNTAGRELWKLGPTGPAERVVDLNPGSASSKPRDLTAFGGGLYFTAVDSGDTDERAGRSLFKVNSSGTVDKVEFEGEPLTRVAYVHQRGDQLFFVASGEGNHRLHLYSIATSGVVTSVSEHWRRWWWHW